jgi:hypothetical protein
MQWNFERLGSGKMHTHRSDQHERLAESFLRSNILVGEWFPEVPVGFRSLEAANYPSIDIVCIPGAMNKFHPRFALKYWREGRISLSGKSVWLIEVEPDLSSVTLGLPIGQLLVYQALIKRDHPGINVVGLGIVCRNGNPFVETVARDLKIHLWKIA